MMPIQATDDAGDAGMDGVRQEFRGPERDAYHEGFFDAQAGALLFPDAGDAYRAGWEAFYRCKQILEDAGFERQGDQFSKTTIIVRGS